MSKLLSGFVIVLIAGFFIASQSLFIVPETKQVIVLQFGNPVKEITNPGLNLKIPFIQNLKVFDKRVLDVDPPPEELILADQKRLVVDAFARYKIVDMLEFYKSFGTETAAADRLYKDINSTLRGTLGNRSLSEILSVTRDEIMVEIQEKVNKSAKENGIEIVDVRIGRADLPPQISQSIYARMKSEREQEAAEFRAQGEELAQEIKSKADRDRTVLIAEAQKTSQIEKGMGDEEAIKIYAEAFNKDPEFYNFYRSMEAYRASLANSETTLVLSPNNEFLKYLEKK